MVDKDKLRKEFILKNPKLNATETLKELRKIGLGKRKTDFLKEFRNIRKLPEPSKAKKEGSIPTKYKTPAQKSRVSLRKKGLPTKRTVQTTLKPKKVIPFAETKFGKITRDLQKKHGISEKKAIIHARKILKIDRSDYDKINEIDVQILLTHTP